MVLPSFTPLFAQIPDNARAERLMKNLTNKFKGNDKFLCSSFDPDSDRFNPKKYWRGPIWINLNWLLYKGLNNYKYKNLAETVKEDSITLIKRYGFYEYFDARKSITENAGYGGNNFSWSAALLLDLLKD